MDEKSRKNWYNKEKKKPKPRGSIFLSDSVTGKLKFSKSVQTCFKRGKGHAAVFFPFSYEVQSFCDRKSEETMFHFVFSGWKISDGLTDEMIHVLKDVTDGYNIVKTFLVIGVNDIRLLK